MDEVARELKSLVGYGATKERVATKPHLQEYGVEGIRSAIKRIHGPQELSSSAQTFTAEQVQAALRILLVFDGEAKRKGWSAPRRRVEALKRLGLLSEKQDSRDLLAHPLVETWRRPNSAEYELMLIVANMLTLGAEFRDAVREVQRQTERRIAESTQEHAALVQEQEALYAEFQADKARANQAIADTVIEGFSKASVDRLARLTAETEARSARRNLRLEEITQHMKRRTELYEQLVDELERPMEETKRLKRLLEEALRSKRELPE